MSASSSPAVRTACLVPNGRVLRLVPTGKLVTALPASWEESWGATEVDGLTELRSRMEGLAEGLASSDERTSFSSRVGSAELSLHPIHRWYYYKEAFSPELPTLILDRLGAGKSSCVADVCAGVGTTPLSLQTSSTAERVIGVEYSPFAHFAAATKLNWWRLSPERLRQHIKRLADYQLDPTLPVPELAAFSNEEIFPTHIRTALLSARAAIEADGELDKNERAFFLLGLAAILEDVSGAMKDGRALRIRRKRVHKQRSLIPRSGALRGDDARDILRNQWLAMVEDLEDRAGDIKVAQHAKVELHRGDARNLAAVEDQTVGLCAYSPPYLNCIDYTEVYKLELWLLELVKNQDEFRQVRLGTLRSHPSVKFAEREAFAGANADVVTVIEDLGSFLEQSLPRPGTGTMVKNYFSDVYEMLIEQARILEPGGHFACIVGNSTFSRRDVVEEKRSEKWRMPILTDVIIARLAEAAGFPETAIWHARDLRPRNVGAGVARESVVVGRR